MKILIKHMYLNTGSITQNVEELSPDLIFHNNFWWNIKSFSKQNSKLRIHSKPDRNQSKLTVLNAYISKLLISFGCGILSLFVDICMFVFPVLFVLLRRCRLLPPYRSNFQKYKSSARTQKHDIPEPNQTNFFIRKHWTGWVQKLPIFSNSTQKVSGWVKSSCKSMLT